MFPQSDSEFYELIKVSGPHHEAKDPPLRREVDAHLLILPPEHQFNINEATDARLYAITTNFSYYPVKTTLKFITSGKAVTLSGTVEDAVKIKPLNRKNQPGINGRFCTITKATSSTRCEIGCSWSLENNGRHVLGDLLIAVETE